jgi:hypothetical protein
MASEEDIDAVIDDYLQENLPAKIFRKVAKTGDPEKNLTQDDVNKKVEALKKHKYR